MKTPYITEKLITKIGGIVHNSVILDVGDIVESLSHAGFDRNDVLVLYKINRGTKNDKEVLIAEIFAKYAFDERVLEYLHSLGDAISVRDQEAGENIISLIGDIDISNVHNHLQNKGSDLQKSDIGKDIYKILSKGFDNDIKQYFFKGIKSQDYVVYLREMLIILSDHYNSLCNNNGIPGDLKEYSAVKAIFDKIGDGIVMQGVLDNENGENIKTGLHSMLNGVFKKLRNIMMHNTQENCDISGDEFIAHATQVNNLLKESRKYFPTKKETK